VISLAPRPVRCFRPCRLALALALALMLAQALGPVIAQASKASPGQPSVLDPDDTSLSPKVRALMAKAQNGRLDVYALVFAFGVAALLFWIM